MAAHAASATSVLRKSVYLGEFSFAGRNAAKRHELYHTVVDMVARSEAHSGACFWHLTLGHVHCCDRALVVGRAADESLLTFLGEAARNASASTAALIMPPPP